MCVFYQVMKYIRLHHNATSTTAEPVKFHKSILVTAL